MDNIVVLEDWKHKTDAVIIAETKDYKDQLVQVYRHSSMCETGVGYGALNFRGHEIAAQ